MAKAYIIVTEDVHDPAGFQAYMGEAAKAMAKKLAGAAFHLHLLALGTQERQTKAGHPTGKVQPNDFVDRGFAKSESAAKDKIIDSLRQGIEKAATKK